MTIHVLGNRHSVEISDIVIDTGCLITVSFYCFMILFDSASQISAAVCVLLLDLFVLFHLTVFQQEAAWPVVFWF